MSDLLYRAFEPELALRASGDGRTVEGRAVPYNVEQRINARLTEVFVPGAFAHQMRAAHRVPFTYLHLPHGGAIIGKTVQLREAGDGLYGEWRVSRTQRGDETLELIKDGLLTQLSIGFREYPGTNKMRASGTVEYTRADLLEVAVVPEGAYGANAVITGTRGPCPTCGHVSGGEHADQGDDMPNMRQAEQIIGSLPLLSSPGSLTRSESNLDNTPNGRKLWNYYLHGAGAGWAASPHPYTALVALLRKNHVPGHSVHGLAANLFHAKFGIWPGERQGKNPAGRG